jgi:hypothetical protein
MKHEKIASLPVTAGIITGLYTEFKVAAVTTTQEIQQSLANRGFASSRFQVFVVCYLYTVLPKKKKKKKVFGFMYQRFQFA